MRRSKRWAAVLLSLTLAVAAPGGVRAEEEADRSSAGIAQQKDAPVQAVPSVQVTTEGSQVYVFESGQQRDDIQLQISNTGNVDLTNLVITPVLNTDVQQWPFNIEMQSEGYAKMIPSLPAGDTVTVDPPYIVTAREEAQTGWYSTVFNVVSAEGLNTNGGIYFKVTQPEKDPGADPNAGQNEAPNADPDADQNEDPNADQNEDPNAGQNEDPNSDLNADSGADSDMEGGYPDMGEGTDMGGGYPDMSGGISQGGSYPDMEDFGGGVSNSSITSNGKKMDSASVPRVIVSGFTTDPQEVAAGSNFRLVVHVQNTSKKKAVSNLLFDLQAPTDGKDADTAAPAFLPASGSSSIYLEKIPAGETRDIAIELNARADLVQKPYSVALTMKYEDGEAAQYEGASSISVPIKQAARFEFSEFEINPEAITVGEEGNVTCSLYNLGRTKLYNVKAKFEGVGIKGKDVFVGNVESGATASIDGMIAGEKETKQDNKVKMTVTYEDEGGSISNVEKELTLPVVKASPEEEMSAMQDMPAEKGFPVIPVVIAAIAVAGAATGILIYKKKKKKALQDEEDELADEIDRPSEDE